jgi:hypothetical protein
LELLEPRTLLATVPVGGEFGVNVVIAADQSAPAVAVGPDGAFLVAWQGPDADGAGIHARRFDSLGHALGDEFPVNTATAQNQTKPSAAVDGSGRAVVVWQGADESANGVYAQRYDAEGAPAGAEFAVNTLTDLSQSAPVVASDATGGFVVAWTDTVHDGDSLGVFARRFDALGAPLDQSEFLVNAGFVIGSQLAPAVASAGAGGFVIAWSSTEDDTQTQHVYARRYAAEGNPRGAPFEVTSEAAPGGPAVEPAVAVAADGSFVIAWQGGDSGGGPGSRVYATRYDAAGAAVGPVITVATLPTTDPAAPAIASDPDGNFILTWHAAGPGGAGLDVHARGYDASGSPEGDAFLVNTTTAGDQAAPVVATNPDRQSVVVWQSPGEDGDGLGIYARRYAAAAANDPPSTSGVAPVSVAEDAASVPVSLFDAFSDSSDADAALTYAVTANTNPALFTSTTIDPATGVLTLAFAPDSSGGADLTVRATDTGGLWVETTFPVTVAAVNDAPVNTVPANRQTPKGTPLVFSAATADGISVADVDAGAGPLRVTLVAANGSLTLSGTAGISFTAGDGTADASMTFFGAPAAINAALDGLRFDPAANFVGTASLTITTDDQGKSGSGGAKSDTDTVNIIVTDTLPPPSISIAGATVPEPDGAATANAVFTVTLSESRPYAVSVQYATQNGAAGVLNLGIATAPADYAAASGTLTFAPGETSKTITVAVAGDALDEVEEGFSVVLSNPTNATLGTSTAAGRIVDNDVAPAMSIGDVTIDEGTEPGAQMVAAFPITLSSPSGQRISVVARLGGGAGDTAGRVSDYNGQSEIVTFEPGETSKVYTVSIVGDSLDEADETFTVLLAFSVTVNFTFADGSAIGTIRDDDPTPTLAIGDVVVVEGDSDAGRPAELVVMLSAPSGLPVSVHYFTQDDTATSPGDYAPVPATTTLTFAPGETTKRIQVRVHGDLLDEADETLNVFLFLPDNATISDDRGVVHIQDDDAPPSLSVQDAVVVEGNDAEHGTSAAVTVTLSAPSGRPVTVGYSTADGTAFAGGDYTAASGTLTFAPGETTQTVALRVAADTAPEADETFSVILSNALDATILDGEGTVTIRDDDTPPRVAEVFVSGTAWSPAFLQALSALGLGSARFGYALPAGTAQLADLVWDSVDRISIRFDSGVSVQQSDLAVRGVNTPSYAVNAFAYDTETKTATWTLARPLGRDKVLLDLDGDTADGVAPAGTTPGAAVPLLDGEWSNGVGAYPSGNGTVGGDFEFRLNVLPGDVDRSARVNALDLWEVRRRLFTSAASPGAGGSRYSVFHDLNGDGRIDSRDLARVRRAQLQFLPAGEPSGSDSPAASLASSLLFSTTPILA